MASVREADLYQTLSIPKTASLRKARRISRRIHRSEHGSPSDVADVADVAEQVLGDAELRARYDSVLDRLRAANMPIPTIGTLIVGVPLSSAYRSPPADSSLAMSAADVDDAAKSYASSRRIGANLKPDTTLIKLLVVVAISIAVIAFVIV
jgi:hypothetical protein